MKAYYHCTELKQLESIMKNGLIPQVGERSAKLGESPGVFLFPSYEDCETALYQWFGDEFDENDKLITLKITLPDDFPLEDSVEYEKISRQVIPAEFIELYKLEF